MSALAFAVALPGLAIGSFLNVVAARVPLRRSIVHPASACTGCGHEIAWTDNIPIVSWLLLRGRCRHCDEHISIRYPAVEVVTAALIVGCFVAFGATALAVLASGFCIVLVTLTAIDVEYRIVPNRIVLPAAAVCLVGQTALQPSPVWAIAALAASGFLLAAALAYPKGMGMGDVKFALLLGAMLGRSVTVALMVGFLSALVPAAVLALRHGSQRSSDRDPLRPVSRVGRDRGALRRRRDPHLVRRHLRVANEAWLIANEAWQAIRGRFSGNRRFQLQGFSRSGIPAMGFLICGPTSFSRSGIPAMGFLICGPTSFSRSGIPAMGFPICGQTQLNRGTSGADTSLEGVL